MTRISSTTVTSLEESIRQIHHTSNKKHISNTKRGKEDYKQTAYLLMVKKQQKTFLTLHMSLQGLLIHTEKVLAHTSILFIVKYLRKIWLLCFTSVLLRSEKSIKTTLLSNF